ncbi:MAG: 50S ribosomal protein L7/L12 [Clostridium sp.]|jgi:ribosomal protein L7/L12|nr:50S ribosomal protein L7/L12 [Clostridium sp.]
MYDKIILISIGLAIILIVCLAMNQLKNEIRRSNILLDKMAKRLGVPEPSEDNKIKALIAEGKKNEAIKRYRDITGAGLKEANDYIEKLI